MVDEVLATLLRVCLLILSRYMFDHELFSDCEIVVESIVNENMTYSLKCTEAHWDREE